MISSSQVVVSCVCDFDTRESLARDPSDDLDDSYPARDDLDDELITQVVLGANGTLPDEVLLILDLL